MIEIIFFTLFCIFGVGVYLTPLKKIKPTRRHHLNYYKRVKIYPDDILF